MEHTSNKRGILYVEKNLLKVKKNKKWRPETTEINGVKLKNRKIRQIK